MRCGKSLARVGSLIAAVAQRFQNQKKTNQNQFGLRLLFRTSRGRFPIILRYRRKEGRKEVQSQWSSINVRSP